MLRFLEMRESIPILKQALADIPDGPVQNLRSSCITFVRRLAKLMDGLNRRKVSWDSI